LSIERTNQVWAIDITYIPMARGFVYLAAVILGIHGCEALSLDTISPLADEGVRPFKPTLGSHRGIVPRDVENCED
jgi:hypothetical protein